MAEGPLGSPVVCPPVTVIEDWIDYNNHLNMAFYSWIFDRGVDYVYDHLGIGAEYTRTGAGSCFTMEVHINYLQELSLDDEVEVHFQVLDYDHKRIHFFEQMFHREKGFLSATSEQIGMHVDMNTRRSSPFPEEVLPGLEALYESHKNLRRAPQIGRVIGIPGRNE